MFDHAAEEGGCITDASGTSAAPGSTVQGFAATGADEDLFADSLARVQAVPEDVANWHGLSVVSRDPGSATQRQALLAAVRAMGTEHPLAAYFRASFLHKLTGEPQELARAGAALMQGKYAGRDRLLLTLLNLAWASALAVGGNRSAFLQILRTAGCPQMLGCLAADLALGEPLIAPLAATRPLSRVALLASSLGGFEHAPTALALNHAALLASMGLEAHVFSTQDMTVPQVETCIVDNDPPQFSRPDAKSWKPPIAGRFEVTLPDSRLSPAARWRNALRQIARFDPDVVLFVGLMSPLLPQFYAARPLLALSLNSVTPLGPHDVWLAGDPEAETEAHWPPDYAAGEVFRYPYRIALTAERAVLSRQTLGVPQNAFVLVTVGFRLNTEIRGVWAARMEAFMEMHPQAWWLLVGSGPALPQALTNKSQRIRALGARTDVRSVWRACDAYVNPPRMGGGFSVAEAMADGLPVLAFAGSDGGAKTGEHALADADAYFARLEELARDPAASRALGSALAARFAANYDLNNAREPLARAMALAQELYFRRSRGEAP
jgi:glycosyltransferase involved in cell wall biosynthesis